MELKLAARAMEVVEVRGGEALGRGFDLNAGRLEGESEGERDAPNFARRDFTFR
jgi:hypothetical protein